jgi:hypothetical protein
MNRDDLLDKVQNLEQVAEVYRAAKEDQLALFLGAGVNGGKWARGHPPCASWYRLLKKLDMHFHSEAPHLREGQNVDNDWIKVAAEMFGGVERETLARAIDDLMYEDVFRSPEKRRKTKSKYKLLAWTVLKDMPTLQAAVCFSAAINDPKKGRSARRNPRIDRILTTNYDFFFGAAWPRFRSMAKSWKTTTWASRHKPHKSAGPIIYLHGYLPYDDQGEKKVILTQEDYDLAYSNTGEEDTGFAWQYLKSAVEECNLLFIGFSFSDAKVAEVLQASRDRRPHFAFLNESDIEQIQAAQNLGVTPVTVSDWDQLPQALKYIYCEGLTETELTRTDHTKESYWEKMEKGLEP